MRYWKNYNDWKIVTLIDQGHSPKEVARDLGISVWTVYRANKRFVPRGNAPKTANQKVCKNCGAHVEFKQAIGPTEGSCRHFCLSLSPIPAALKSVAGINFFHNE